MRILVDATPLFPYNRGRGPTGVGRWTARAASALAALEPDWQIDLVIESSRGASIDESWARPNIALHEVRLPSLVYRGLRYVRLLPAIDRLVGPADIVLGSNYIPLRARDAVEVPVIYDLSFIHHPETVSRKHLYFLRFVLPRAVRKSPVVITISQAMRSEITSHYDIPSERVSVVTPGCDLERFTGDTMAGRSIPGLPESFFLYVGTLEPRKNLPGLLRAYRLLTERQPDAPALVLAGAIGWRVKDLVRELETRSSEQKIVTLGYVDDELMPALYARAHALVFPSFYEGFGLPALEAMASGCPVIASNRSAIPEVVGDAALLIDPYEPATIAAAMEDSFQETRHATLVAAGRARALTFTWERTGRELRDALKRASAYRGSIH